MRLRRVFPEVRSRPRPRNCGDGRRQHGNWPTGMTRLAFCSTSPNSQLWRAAFRRSEGTRDRDHEVIGRDRKMIRRSVHPPNSSGRHDSAGMMTMPSSNQSSNVNLTEPPVTSSSTAQFFVASSALTAAIGLRPGFALNLARSRPPLGWSKIATSYAVGHGFTRVRRRSDDPLPQAEPRAPMIMAPTKTRLVRTGPPPPIRAERSGLSLLLALSGSARSGWRRYYSPESTTRCVRSTSRVQIVRRHAPEPPHRNHHLRSTNSGLAGARLIMSSGAPRSSSVNPYRRSGGGDTRATKHRLFQVAELRLLSRPATAPVIPTEIV